MMNHNYRPGRDHYGNEIDQEFYLSAGYSAQSPQSYPNAATAHVLHQNAMLAQLSQAHGNGIQQHFIPEDVRYRMQHNDFNNVVQPIYYKHPQSVQKEVEHRHEKLQEKRDDERYAEVYEEAFDPNSRTTISGTRTSTERTEGIRAHTSSSSRSTSRYGSSTTSSSESDDVNWEDNIMSALNDMAGNFKKIGGIHCNQAGPDTTEVQLKLNLPLPMEFVDNLDVKEGFNNAMASLSPKKCGNMQYGYSHLDDHVIDMEERFLGTMDQIEGNMVPVYKSLFQTQSESSDEDEDDDGDVNEIEEDQSESTYEDPRFLPNIDQNLQQRQKESFNAVQSSTIAQNLDKIPLQIILSNPSGMSSADSWQVMPPRDEPRKYPDRSATNNIISTINNNLDVALRRRSNENENNRRSEQPVPASKQTNELANREAKEAKSEKRDLKANTEIPQVINIGNGENGLGCYSDLTIGFQMSTRPSDEKDKPTSKIPAIKTQFSGDEIMGRRKASFQRNSSKKGENFNSGMSDLREDKAIFDKADPPPTTTSPCSRSHSMNKSTDVSKVICNGGDEITERMKVEKGLDDEYANHYPAKKLDEKRRLDEDREETEVIENKRNPIEVEAKSVQEEALESKRLEKRVEEEIKAARDALKANKLEERRKIREAKEKASEAKRLQEERQKREFEAKAVEEVQRAKALEEEKKRIEAEAIVAEEALEAKRLEGERKRRVAEEKSAQEVLKARKLEEERKRIEVETKNAQEALEALYAKKLNEERKLRKVEARIDEEKRRRDVKTKALEAKKLEEEKIRLQARTNAVEKPLETMELKVKRKRMEAKTKGDQDENEGTSLYRVQGFEDYCKSISTAKVNVDDDSKALQTDIDSSDDGSAVERLALSISESDGTSEQNKKSLPSHEEESGAGGMGFDEETYSSNPSSLDTHSSDGESDIFTDATSFVEDSESKMIENTSDVRSSSTTERLRNDYQSQNVEIKYLSEATRSVDYPFSSEETVNTMDKTVQSFLTKDTYRESTGSLRSFSNSKFPMKSSKLSSYTCDQPIPIAATMSTLQTFDQGTVYSGQHSLGRFIKSSDESIFSSASNSHHSAMSLKPVAQSVSVLPRETKKKDMIGPESRSSIIGRAVSFILWLVLRIIFTIILFLYTWIKHMVTTIRKREASKIDCTPTQFALQPDQAIRREEIQDRIMDNITHKKAGQQHRIPYLGYEDPLQEHYTTTMIIKHPSSSKGYFTDESDEVGTCVESIVPDAHNPNISDGKISAWKITQNNTETSSLSYPQSTSFHVLKSAYSALSSTKREGEKSNWLEQPTIDDEISYYE